MGIRAARKIRATRSTIAIAVVFSIISGVSTFADEDSPGAYSAGMIQNATSQLWQSTEDEEAAGKYVCMI